MSENMTLDGVVEDPDGGEGTVVGGWFTHLTPEDRAAWSQALGDEAQSSGALLLGARSDAWFAQRWRDRTGAWADRLNTLPKYVVSHTNGTPHWTNVTVLSADLAEVAATVRRDVDGDVVVYGSVSLARALLARGLLDELRLIVFPVVLGRGRRLFDDLGARRDLRLIDAGAIGGLTRLRYEVAH